MAPNDGDQTNERESRVEEIMKGYRRDHPPSPRVPQDEDRPKTESAPRGRRSRATRSNQ